MEFWGVEVKGGEPFKVSPGDGMVLHLSQACFGELKMVKGNESVCLYVTIDGKKLVLGTLFTEKLPQQQFDLVFDKDFELTHNWKKGSVYFYGYKASNPVDESDESDSEEEYPITLSNSGKPESKAKQEKPVETEISNAAKNKESGSFKQKVTIVEPNKDEEDESGDDDMSGDNDENDSEDEDDSNDSDESEETPKKVEPSKKRAAESASKTPSTVKKGKLTPQKTDVKKVSGHVATPHPTKQAGKTPANKPNPQTPKSGGSHTCKSCNRGFISDKALESHSKAKHGGDK